MLAAQHENAEDDEPRQDAESRRCNRGNPFPGIFPDYATQSGKILFGLKCVSYFFSKTLRLG